MPWFELKGDERITQHCATDGCGGQPTWRLEVDGAGSVYCSGCKASITEGRKHLREWQHANRHLSDLDF